MGNSSGGGGLLIAGIVVLIIGIILLTPLIDWLITFMGWAMIVGGVILGGVGVIQMLSGRKSSF